MNRLGRTFAEELSAVSRKASFEKKSFSLSLQWRITFFYGFILLGFLVLIFRGFSLTMIHGRYYAKLADNNRLREKIIPAERGVIFDRNGVALAQNAPVFLEINGDGSINRVSKKAYLQARLEGKESEKFTLGLERLYPYASASAHAVGFVGRVNSEELSLSVNDYRYGPADMAGRSGAEAFYEEKLRGQNGKEMIEVDAREKKIRSLGILPPLAGQSLYLSIDQILQDKITAILRGVKGAVIVSDPKTGEILALVSSPSFNPQTLSAGAGEAGAVLSDQDQPLFNRALSGLYPPGSTFKIITAAAGLEEKAVTADSVIEDTGIISIGPYSFSNWYYIRYGKTEGPLNMVRALQRSNDIYFYRLGEKIGVRGLAKWMKIFGLGEKTGIDLPSEAEGTAPDEEWKKKTMGENWYLGDTFHLSIGQGNLLATPLQVNEWTNIIANNGVLCTPHIVKNEKRKTKSESLKCRNLEIRKETIETVREGMRLACQPGGTGWPLFKFKVKSEKLKIDDKNFLEAREGTGSGILKGWVEVPVACKTGTAEYGDPENKTHAWFTAFAPVYNPQISVTVLIESGGEGSSTAGPIAKEIIAEYFSR